MKRELLLLGGIASLFIVAACGSTTAGALGGAPAPATATAAPSITPTSVPPPTQIPVAAATATPTPVHANPAPATGTATTLRSVGTLGEILIGPDGDTMYIFLSDTGTKSTCYGSCAQNWPPLTTMGGPRALGGVSQSMLGTTRRDDGALQVTYDGHPLYSFIADGGPGMASGEGIDAFGARWEVIDAAGMAVLK